MISHKKDDYEELLKKQKRMEHELQELKKEKERERYQQQKKEYYEKQKREEKEYDQWYNSLSDEEKAREDKIQEHKRIANKVISVILILVFIGVFVGIITKFTIWESTSKEVAGTYYLTNISGNYEVERAYKDSNYAILEDEKATIYINFYSPKYSNTYTYLYMWNILF